MWPAYEQREPQRMIRIERELLVRPICMLKVEHPNLFGWRVIRTFILFFVFKIWMLFYGFCSLLHAILLFYYTFRSHNISVQCTIELNITDNVQEKCVMAAGKSVKYYDLMYTFLFYSRITIRVEHGRVQALQTVYVWCASIDLWWFASLNKTVSFGLDWVISIRTTSIHALYTRTLFTRALLLG